MSSNCHVRNRAVANRNSEFTRAPLVSRRVASPNIIMRQSTVCPCGAIQLTIASYGWHRTHRLFPGRSRLPVSPDSQPAVVSYKNQHRSCFPTSLQDLHPRKCRQDDLDMKKTRRKAKLESADVALLKKSQKRGGERASAIADLKPMWTTRPGKFVRGYVSAVDGSVQPYGVIIPSGYDPKKPTRLDVVLHGRWRRCRG